MLEPIFRLIDTITSPLPSIPPVYTILVVALAASFILMLLNKVLIDQTLVAEFKKQQQSFYKKMRGARKAKDFSALKKADKDSQRMMQLQKKYFKEMMKVWMVTFLLFPVIFFYLGYKYGGLPIVVQLPFTLPWLGSSLGWLGWYIVCSAAPVTIFRKVLKVQ